MGIIGVCFVEFCISYAVEGGPVLSYFENKVDAKDSRRIP